MIPFLLHDFKARTTNFFLYSFVNDVGILTNKLGNIFGSNFVIITLNPAFFSIDIIGKRSGTRYLFTRIVYV